MKLSELTTLQVGGEAQNIVFAATADELIDSALAAWASDDEWLILGGGSNIVVADDGFAGTVICVVTRGIERSDTPAGVILRVQAGEPWDALVATTVELGLSGIEALAGIPGSTGAAPIQNIGAYGQELSTTLDSIAFLDYLDGEVVRLSAAELQFGYRSSALKAGRAGVVLSIDLRLSAHEHGLSDPILFPQLAAALGVELGERLPVAQVRDAVLRLRRSKGMVLDPADADSVSAGSFFTNPIVSRQFSRSLPAETPRWNVGNRSAGVPADLITPLESFIPPGLSNDDSGNERSTAAGDDGSNPDVKLSAAWLIEHSGITRGFSLPGSCAAISGKHSLAIVNTGGATAEQVAELARYVQARVLASFGVNLNPEPVLVGVRV